MYPQDFKGTSSKLGLENYTATWFNISDADAAQQGYATSYSMSGPDDDFVETVSTMLTEGKGKWDEMKAGVNTVARQALQQKEDYVVTYFAQAWNIDFYRLQTRVQTALSGLYAPPAVADVFGNGKTYTRASATTTNTTLMPQPAAFLTIYNTAKTGLAAVGGAGRVLDSLAVVATSTTALSLRLYYHNTAGSAFQANWAFAVTRDATTGYTFAATATLDGNATVIATGVTALVNYFAGKKFTIDWYANPNTTNFPRVQFTPGTTPTTYFIARLLP
jgi:hypothetical protein